MPSNSLAKQVSMTVNAISGEIERVTVRVLPDGRMSRADAARYLGHDKATLAKWQAQGRGPNAVRVGGKIFYYQRELDAFIRGETA